MLTVTLFSTFRRQGFCFIRTRWLMRGSTHRFVRLFRQWLFNFQFVFYWLSHGWCEVKVLTAFFGWSWHVRVEDNSSIFTESRILVPTKRKKVTRCFCFLHVFIWFHLLKERPERKKGKWKGQNCVISNDRQWVTLRFKKGYLLP